MISTYLGKAAFGLCALATVPAVWGQGTLAYKCSLTQYVCTKQGPIPIPASGRDVSGDDSVYNPQEIGGDPVDGLEYQLAAPQNGDEGR